MKSRAYWLLLCAYKSYGLNSMCPTVKQNSCLSFAVFSSKSWKPVNTSLFTNSGYQVDSSNRQRCGQFQCHKAENICSVTSLFKMMPVALSQWFIAGEVCTRQKTCIDAIDSIKNTLRVEKTIVQLFTCSETITDWCLKPIFDFVLRDWMGGVCESKDNTKQ